MSSVFTAVGANASLPLRITFVHFDATYEQLIVFGVKK